MMKSPASTLPARSSLFDPLGVIGFSSIEAPLLAALATADVEYRRTDSRYQT